MKSKKLIKFCGITNLKDALNAQNSGCDAIGFVFVKRSKRYIEPNKCQEIIQELSPMLTVVALFSDNSEAEIKEVISNCNIHVLQFHGNETPEFCRQWNKKYWKAIPMADAVSPMEYANKYPDASAYLIDNYGTKRLGGSGEVFDWSRIPNKCSAQWILAGGLTTNNLKEALENTAIENFDVSSGIEKSPGMKSKTKMKEFIRILND